MRITELCSICFSFMEPPLLTSSGNDLPLSWSLDQFVYATEVAPITYFSVLHLLPICLILLWRWLSISSVRTQPRVWHTEESHFTIIENWNGSIACVQHLNYKDVLRSGLPNINIGVTLFLAIPSSGGSFQSHNSIDKKGPRSYAAEWLWILYWS